MNNKSYKSVLDIQDKNLISFNEKGNYTDKWYEEYYAEVAERQEMRDYHKHIRKQERLAIIKVLKATKIYNKNYYEDENLTDEVVPNCKKQKGDSPQVNFDIEIKGESQSEISDVRSVNQSENANSEIAESVGITSEMEFFEENPINEDESIEAYSNLTRNEIYQTKTQEIKTVPNVVKAPKPIIVKNIQNFVNFSTKIEKDCDSNFIVKIAQEDLKIFPNDLVVKNKIIDYLRVFLLICKEN